MSEDKEIRMDEKYFDLQYKLIDTKLAAISNAVDVFGKEITKILDDHEMRLREHAKETASSTNQITELKAELKELRRDTEDLKKEIALCEKTNDERFLKLESNQEEKKEQELSIWQNLAMEAIKSILFGGALAGAYYGLIQLIGS